MNPRLIKSIGRKRKAAGWTLLILGLLVAAVWLWSGWGIRRVRVGNFSAGCFQGHLHVIWLAVPPTDSSGVDQWTLAEQASAKAVWMILDQTDEYARLPRLTFTGKSDLALALEGMELDGPLHELPAWPIPLLLWTPAAALLCSGYLARKRAITGMCKSCGYELAGLSSDAPCPECGRANA